MDELKPCPFCGGEAERIDFGPGDAENEGGSCIACKRCQSSGPVEFGFKETFISKWNTRAASGVDDAVLEWISRNLLGQNRDYAIHVLKRGGTGDAGDLRSFVVSMQGKPHD